MATSDAPTTERGTQTPMRNGGFGLFGAGFQGLGVDEREVVRDLRWPHSVRVTYPRMLNDAQVQGLYLGATLPIRQYAWSIKPNGARPEVSARVCEDYGLPLHGTDPGPRRRTQRRFRFDKHLEDALRAIGYGHRYFEQVGEIRDDGLWHLRKLADRPPHTIREIRTAADGSLAYIRVPALNPDAALLNDGVKLPVEHLVGYVWDQEGANWFGHSMLRPCYRPWKVKDRIVAVGAINIERAGGVPYIEAPEGAGKTQMAELHQLAAEFRVGQGAGAALPHGATLKFAQAAGGDQAVNYIRLQNEEMARAWLMMFMQLGQTETGSRALGSTFVDYLALAQNAIAQWFCDIFNEYVIEDDVEFNEGPDEPYAPMLTFEQVGNPAAELAASIDDAQSAGAMPADSQVAAQLDGAPRARRRGRGRVEHVATAAEISPAEQAQTDFADLQARYDQAVTDLEAAWVTVRAAQIDELVAQAHAVTTAAELAALTATVAGGATLAATLVSVVEHGAQSVADEAAAQGVTLEVADLEAAHTTIADAADATASLVTRALGQSAASAATPLASLPADDRAAIVREHLDGLAGATDAYEFAGLASQAQNEGRFAALAGAPDSTRFYASELNDTATCELCAAEDDTEFDSLADARRDYPAGGFVGCQGGKRCRGTIVATYAEA